MNILVIQSRLSIHPFWLVDGSHQLRQSVFQRSTEPAALLWGCCTLGELTLSFIRKCERRHVGGAVHVCKHLEDPEKNDKENSISSVCTGKWNHLALYFSTDCVPWRLREYHCSFGSCAEKLPVCCRVFFSTPITMFCFSFVPLQPFQFPVTRISVGRMMKTQCKDHT